VPLRLFRAQARHLHVLSAVTFMFAEAANTMFSQCQSCTPQYPCHVHSCALLAQEAACSPAQRPQQPGRIEFIGVCAPGASTRMRSLIPTMHTGLSDRWSSWRAVSTLVVAQMRSGGSVRERHSTNAPGFQVSSRAQTTQHVCTAIRIKVAAQRLQ
jgi:hypothetical protein